MALSTATPSSTALIPSHPTISSAQTHSSPQTKSNTLHLQSPLHQPKILLLQMNPTQTSIKPLPWTLHFQRISHLVIFPQTHLNIPLAHSQMPQPKLIHLHLHNNLLLTLIPPRLITSLPPSTSLGHNTHLNTLPPSGLHLKILLLPALHLKILLLTTNHLLMFLHFKNHNIMTAITIFNLSLEKNTLLSSIEQHMDHLLSTYPLLTTSRPTVSLRTKPLLLLTHLIAITRTKLPLFLFFSLLPHFSSTYLHRCKSLSSSETTSLPRVAFSSIFLSLMFLTLTLHSVTNPTTNQHLLPSTNTHSHLH